MVLPNPDFIDLQGWADSLVVEYSQTVVPAYNPNLTTWQRWGDSVLSTPPFNLQDLPRPSLFSNWKEWAKVVQGILESQA